MPRTVVDMSKHSDSSSVSRGRRIPMPATLLAGSLILSLLLIPAEPVSGASIPQEATLAEGMAGSLDGLARDSGSPTSVTARGETAESSSSSDGVPRVNVPHFDGTIAYPETALFWFGEVTPLLNYGDVRLGYNASELLINVAVFDRRLWYPATPSAETLTAWDSVSLYLDLDGPQGDSPSSTAYRLDGALLWWEAADAYRTAYRGDGSAWTPSDLAFTAPTAWRGDAPNNDIDDRGWSITYHIPFASLGLESAPGQGTVWGLGVRLHDRDDASGTPIPDQAWPTGMDVAAPATWGQLAFGLPVDVAPDVSPSGTILIRQGSEGIVVPDAAVGGGSICGEGMDYFSEWGVRSYAGEEQFNIQNQADVADWPCFSKYFVDFPTEPIPPGKVILSATLILHQFGNAGAPGQAQPSLIQVSTVSETWTESELTWNSAPLASENVSRTWVDPLEAFPGWPGVARSWDVTRALAEAYASGVPLQLALYSADFDYHSGKYFTTSNAEDWDAEGRPALEIVWGDPVQEGAFQDVPPSYWAYEYIESLFQAGYVAGCSSDPPLYCPDRILTRAESAVFILRGAHGAIASPPTTPPSTPSFADVEPTYWGFGWIESLIAEGYTAGCGTDPLIYCPLRDHTRAEGSVFFLRIKNGITYTPPAPTGLFTDVDPAAWYAGWVEAAYNEGLLPACSTSPLQFCPEGSLDRSWAAYMMVMAKGGLPLQ
jgi:hypothetical protein